MPSVATKTPGAKHIDGTFNIPYLAHHINKDYADTSQASSDCSDVCDEHILTHAVETLFASRECKVNFCVFLNVRGIRVTGTCSQIPSSPLVVVLRAHQGIPFCLSIAGLRAILLGVPPNFWIC